MGDPLIINVALTGCVARKADNPAIPITPQEVAVDARRCADEGATVFHVHARDEAGNPAWGRGRYAVLVEAVRAAVPGAVVCVSLSGRHFRHFQERSAALLAAPDLATLTMGSVDFRDGTAENSWGTVNGLLQLMGYWNVRPECEVLDLGHAVRLRELAENGKLKKPIYANVILGVHLPATMWMFDLMAAKLNNVRWGATAIGKDAWWIQQQAVNCGAHVRVGLEDSLWMERGDPATNPRLVARVVGYARSQHDREPATFGEARRMLGL